MIGTTRGKKERKGKGKKLLRCRLSKVTAKKYYVEKVG